MTPLLSGIHYDVSAEDYRADPTPEPSLSRSVAKTIISESPLHGFYSHPRLGLGSVPSFGVERETKMDFGELGHQMLLGKGSEVVVGPWPTWQTNDSKAFYESAKASGKIPVLQHVYDRATMMTAGARSELERLGIAKDFDAATSEVTIIWQEEGQYLRCRPDKLLIHEDTHTATIFDLKIGGMANPQKIDRQIDDMFYDLQAVYYTRGLTAARPDLAGRVRFKFLFVEDSWPFTVVDTELSGEYRATGESRFNRAFKAWKTARTSGVWPRFTSGTYTANPPPWALAREMSAG